MKNTIEEIEKSFWGDPPENSSSLVNKCYTLRKKELSDFTTEDFRLLIGQDRALEIIIPLALNLLRKNIFCEGDFYQGDLLKNVLVSEKAYWKSHPETKNDLIKLVETNIHALEELDVIDDIKKEIKEAFEDFKRE